MKELASFVPSSIYLVSGTRQSRPRLLGRQVRLQGGQETRESFRQHKSRVIKIHDKEREDLNQTGMRLPTLHLHLYVGKTSDISTFDQHLGRESVTFLNQPRRLLWFESSGSDELESRPSACYAVALSYPCFVGLFWTQYAHLPPNRSPWAVCTPYHNPDCRGLRIQGRRA